jgi:hypothetical protein
MDKCAFEVGCACAALTKKKCDKCYFRRSEEDLREGRRKASERIKTLPEEQQKHITSLYYSYTNRNRWEGDEFVDKRRKHQAACSD